MEAADRAPKKRNLALACATREVARWGSSIVAAIAVMCVVACGDDAASVRRLPTMAAAQPAAAASYKSSDEDLNPRLLRRFKPLAPLQDKQPQALVDLGRLLYFEPLMSRDRKISCNTCHPLDRYGATATAVSTGVDGRQGARNAPSTYNASGHFRQFWDGRSASSVEQVSSPIQNPLEMEMDEATLVGRLSDIEGYRRAFEQSFPGSAEPITLGHVAAAVAEFQRGLRTPARWDLYLAGNKTVLTTEEKAGAKLFANLGCMVCHEGQYLGGSMFQRAGVVIPWPNQKDRGRRDITHDVADDMMFKVPSLRNVAKTAPYFHDGSVATLNEAVQMMARHQLGISLTFGEADLIVTWMGSLTGTISADYVRRPELPAAIRP
jgi:cytochrome c peroxidase